jgi:FkbM family methyltransferase
LTGKPVILSDVCGYSVALDTSETIQRGIYCGTYDREETKWLKDILKPGMIFVDVGANIGHYSLIASTLVGDKGEVFSFDPSKYAYDKLGETILNNGITNIHAFNSGLGDIESEKVLYDQLKDTHSPSFLISSTGTSMGVMKITTLDRFTKEHRINFIDMIKIDAEGYEPNILMGSTRLLKENRIYYLLIEINEGWLRLNNTSSKVLHDTVVSHGFKQVKAVYEPGYSNRLYVNENYRGV